jgi:hypothetical protein
LDGNDNPQLRTLIPHVPTLGAEAKHVLDAAALVTGGNATHYWEDSGIVGRLYERTLGIEGIYAWDVWLVYKPGVRWNGEYPPKPDFAMHQLGSRVDEVMPRLDSREFAKVVNGYLAEMEAAP